jgi:hypothetical protein
LKPSPPLTDHDMLKAWVDRFTLLIITINNRVLRRRAPPNNAFAWWNHECTAAARQVRRAPPEAVATARRHLHHTFRLAKRAWLENNLASTSLDLWSVTKWRKGRRVSHVPPLDTGAGPTSDRSEMDAALREHFFGRHKRHPIWPDLPGDPAVARTWIPITEDEVSRALATGPGTSAPGPSGIPYWVLRWAHEADNSHLTTIFNACLDLGCHPWPDATVIAIPKPDKPDYTKVKAFRPITLLECMGKTLEKIIANRLQVQSETHLLIGPGQFAQRHHFATDAATVLRMKIEQTRRAGRLGFVCLFDISGFYDSLDPHATCRTLTHGDRTGDRQVGASLYDQSTRTAAL